MSTLEELILRSNIVVKWSEKKSAPGLRHTFGSQEFNEVVYMLVSLLEKKNYEILRGGLHLIKTFPQTQIVHFLKYGDEQSLKAGLRSGICTLIGRLMVI